MDQVDEAIKPAHDGRLWFPSKQVLGNLKFVKRIVSSDLRHKDTTSVSEALCFEGRDMFCSFRFIGDDTIHRHLAVSLWVMRQSREAALSELNEGRSTFPFKDAWDDERARKIADRWDTLLHFRGFGADAPRLSISTYAHPLLFDRMLTMPMAHCRVSLMLKIGVLLHPNEVGAGGDGVRDRGVLPAVTEPEWEGEPESFTAGELEDLTLTYEPVEELDGDDDLDLD